MTPEEAIDDLFQKYGEDFNWHILPSTNKTFVAELKMKYRKFKGLLKVKEYIEQSYIRDFL